MSPEQKVCTLDLIEKACDRELTDTPVVTDVAVRPSEQRVRRAVNFPNCHVDIARTASCVRRSIFREAAETSQAVGLTMSSWRMETWQRTRRERSGSARINVSHFR